MREFLNRELFTAVSFEQLQGKMMKCSCFQGKSCCHGCSEKCFTADLQLYRRVKSMRPHVGAEPYVCGTEKYSAVCPKEGCVVMCRLCG